MSDDFENDREEAQKGGDDFNPAKPTDGIIELGDDDAVDESEIGIEAEDGIDGGTSNEDEDGIDNYEADLHHDEGAYSY